jgi:predicted ATPase with chaperone activity
MTTTQTPIQAIAAARCRSCGAIRPTNPPPRIDQVIGVEHAKRAAEVALACGHPITFRGIGDPTPAITLARFVAAHGGTAYAILPCPCGNHGDPDLACACTPAMIARYQKRPALRTARDATIQTEVPRPSIEKIRQYLAGRRGEPDEQVLTRIQEALTRPEADHKLDVAGDRLMTAAIRQLHLSTAAAERIIAVATTVARLAHVTQISPAHIAEAIQYSRHHSMPTGLTE